MNTATAGPVAFALLTDGSTVEIRPATPQDTGAVREMHAAMSADNMYRRFFSLNPRAAEQEAKRVCRPPGPEHAALLAWQSGRLVGVASYEPIGSKPGGKPAARPGDHPGVAEIAFAVPDDMHRRGIATLLLEHLVSLARQRGLVAFTAETLADNSPMLRVFADAGLPARRHYSDGVVELTFPLPGSEADIHLAEYLSTVASRESYADVASLRPLLQPSSVAVIGASRHRGTIGRAILRNIVACGFAGRIYAVNPHARSVEGVSCVPSIDALPEPVDLAVVVVPTAAVADAAARCGRRGVRGLAVITANLGEVGADLLAICRRYGMRLIGPNCFGVMVPSIGLNATFAATRPEPGVAGLVVQSGGVGIALIEHLSRLGIGVSSFASTGDKYDVSSNDLLTWWEQDGVTRLAILYVESFGSPRKFARTARRVGQQMPVLTVLAGRSPAGQRAAASHTAAVATPLVTQEALFDQTGVIATDSLGELTEAIAFFACQPLPAGDRVAIVTNAGGAGVLAADACGDHGLQVVKLSAPTRRRLRRLLPPGAKLTGPVETTAGVTTAAFRTCLEEVAADDGVDAVLVVSVPTAITDLRLAITTAAISKPVVVSLLDQAESVQLLRPAEDGPAEPPEPPAEPGPGPAGLRGPGVTGRPAYAYPESAARALGHAVRYQAWQVRQQGRIPDFAGLRTAEARTLIAGFLTANPVGGWLPASQATELLSCYGIPMIATVSAATEEEAVRAAAGFGGRVVLKAEADGQPRKRGAGSVRLDLRTAEEVSQAYRGLAADFGPSLRRVLVQPMLSGGVEALIGVVQEPVFGPLVIFGLGGVATEILGDHAARLTPLTDADADELIRSVRAAPLLFGHRGSPPVDTAGLAQTLLRVSRLADDLPELTEIDLNPVVVGPDGVTAVGVRVRISPSQPRDPFLRELR
ncbi:MAG: GNAT family N-acetyltransferase [Streptosporangiaceae bacterium]